MDENPPPFRPAWWLPGRHLPAVWGKFGRREQLAHDRVARWSTPDGDHLSIFRMGVMEAGRPHLLVLHGLEAKPNAKYAHGLLRAMRALGWSGDLMMFRTCDGEINRARRLYHSGETTDLAVVVQRLLHEQPEVRLSIAGVSLGGNVLLKWLGELGDLVPTQVERAATVSVPYDLAAGSRVMEHGFARVYVRHFLHTLKAKGLEKLKQFPDLCDRDALLRARTFWEFDDALTAPVHGFRNAGDYYDRSSSIRFLERIRRPAFLLSAHDDPFLPASVLGDVATIATRNPALRTEFTPRGSHVGFVEGSPFHQTYYFERRLARWFTTGT